MSPRCGFCSRMAGRSKAIWLKSIAEISNSNCGGMARGARNSNVTDDPANRRQEMKQQPSGRRWTMVCDWQRLRCLNYCCGAGFIAAFAAFKNLFPQFLRGGLDFLHLLADARSGGLVAALGLAYILSRLIHQPLEVLVFLHGR